MGPCPLLGISDSRMEEGVSLGGDREEGSAGIVSDAPPPSGQLCLQPLDSPKVQVSLKPENPPGLSLFEEKNTK